MMKVLGHDFAPMTELDWYGFAGAPEGTLIAHTAEGTPLLYDPATGVVSEMLEDGGQIDWTPTRIN